ncbi:MAG: RNA-directed DNA polymerase [Pseudomonadota bacterium]
MKRLGQVWAEVVSFENLLLAYRKARMGKGRSPAVAHFALNLERELLTLQAQLHDGSYQPGAYRLFTVYERKPRLIAAAPFRDRVVHHAVMNSIEPPLDRRFIDDSYACRKGKGVHAAVDRYQGWANRYAYALKMDVQQYFPSIDHGILKQKLRRCIKDDRLLRLLDRIIETSPETEMQPDWFPGDDLFTPLERRRGIPIGNLTSQFFANLYLDDLDHYLKETLRCAACLRYVDDIVVLGDDKTRLREIREAVRDRLAGDRLRLHPRKAHIMPVSAGIDFLGYRVFPEKRLLRNDNGHRFARKLRRFAKAYAEGRMDWEDFNPSVQSWIGHACHADTLGLRRVVFADTIFSRGAGRKPANA